MSRRGSGSTISCRLGRVSVDGFITLGSLRGSAREMVVRPPLKYREREEPDRRATVELIQPTVIHGPWGVARG
jgi:hypothetical protein